MWPLIGIYAGIRLFVAVVEAVAEEQDRAHREETRCRMRSAYLCAELRRRERAEEMESVLMSLHHQLLVARALGR